MLLGCPGHPRQVLRPLEQTHVSVDRCFAVVDHAGPLVQAIEELPCCRDEFLRAVVVLILARNRDLDCVRCDARNSAELACS